MEEAELRFWLEIPPDAGALRPDGDSDGGAVAIEISGGVPGDVDDIGAANGDEQVGLCQR